MSNQITNNLVMIRPKYFGYNTETIDNIFQRNVKKNNIPEAALKEFESFLTMLKDEEVKVAVFDDVVDIFTPDSVFPNNWLTLHSSGDVFAYEMFSKTRQKEVRFDIFQNLKDLGFNIKQINDWTKNYGVLEGTGAFVFDHDYKIAYLNISKRASLKTAKKWCEKMGYKLIWFNSFTIDNNVKTPIYHTNVMLCIGINYAIVCLDSILDLRQREMVKQSLINSNKKIIEISIKQVFEYCGNALQVLGQNNKHYLVMSSRAWKALDKKQQTQIKEFNDVITPNLDIIEKVGGGSARCMIAENFLTKK